VAKRLHEYPNVRTDLDAVFNELQREMNLDSPDPMTQIAVRFAFLAKCKGIKISPMGMSPEETLRAQNFFLDFVLAIHGD